MSISGEDQYPWWLNEPQAEAHDYEHWDEWDRNHWRDDMPEDVMEPADEQAIQNAYDDQFYGD